MASVRGRDTGPEITVRKALHAAGLRFRVHAKELPGKPDIVLPGRRLAVFVHGCEDLQDQVAVLEAKLDPDTIPHEEVKRGLGE